ncbi:hypothetical protein DH2020_016485 [Rehmannia glutinosa]|uniref:Uncharacterized protein n=1 Tax=Rehmannia glutinosa TaxID=99300 RepID=A0ABR0WRZ4_REHGL
MPRSRGMLVSRVIGLWAGQSQFVLDAVNTALSIYISQRVLFSALFSTVSKSLKDIFTFEVEKAEENGTCTSCGFKWTFISKWKKMNKVEGIDRYGEKVKGYDCCICTDDLEDVGMHYWANPLLSLFFLKSMEPGFSRGRHIVLAYERDPIRAGRDIPIVHRVIQNDNHFSPQTAICSTFVIWFSVGDNNDGDDIPLYALYILIGALGLLCVITSKD